MRTIHHIAALLGVGCGVVASAMPWVEADLVSGQSVSAQGSQSGALLWSFSAVVLAAYGLQFVTRGVLRRFAAAIQLLAAASVGVLSFLVLSDPLVPVLSEITELTGVEGVATRELVSMVSLTGWHFALVVGSLLQVLSGVLGVIMGERIHNTSRFETHHDARELEDSAATWDALSDGADPTKR
ncbi:MAG: hypothetical protein RL247_822 [Actinomycetota bacterium]